MACQFKLVALLVALQLVSTLASPSRLVFYPASTTNQGAQALIAIQQALIDTGNAVTLRLFPMGPVGYQNVVSVANNVAPTFSSINASAAIVFDDVMGYDSIIDIINMVRT